MALLSVAYPENALWFSLRKVKLLQGLSLSSLGEHAKAEEAHKKAIQLDRSFIEAWAHLAQVSTKLKSVSPLALKATFFFFFVCLFENLLRMLIYSLLQFGIWKEKKRKKRRRNLSFLLVGRFGCRGMGVKF